MQQKLLAMLSKQRKAVPLIQGEWSTYTNGKLIRKLSKTFGLQKSACTH